MINSANACPEPLFQTMAMQMKAVQLYYHGLAWPATCGIMQSSSFRGGTKVHCNITA